jgi:Zn-finger nucleic acid-binding protein
MIAETLNCPMCGAAAATASVHCAYCDARLATIACPSCFGMMFKGSRHCPHCGALGACARTANDASTRHCPRCPGIRLEPVELGATMLFECPQCDGIWMEAAAFERICADREQQSAVLGAPSPVPSPAAGLEARGNGGAVRYVPCPECGQLMNRLNFARCSGVIVDLCKGHGTWFDREELRGIVEFIRAGGLETSRQKEKEQIAEARQRLQQDQFAADTRADFMTGMNEREHRRTGVLSVAKDLLGLLMD